MAVLHPVAAEDHVVITRNVKMWDTLTIANTRKNNATVLYLFHFPVFLL